MHFAVGWSWQIVARWERMSQKHAWLGFVFSCFCFCHPTDAQVPIVWLMLDFKFDAFFTFRDTCHGLHWPIWPCCNGRGKTPLYVWSVLVGREDVMMTATVYMYDLRWLAGKTWRWLLQSEQSTLRHHRLCLVCMLWWSENWRTTILCFPMTFLHQAKVSVWR